MVRKATLYILPLAIIITACAELQQIVNTTMANQPLTQTEIIAGLKEALSVGTDSAAKRLSKADGYYRDELVKILLPPEANTIIRNISRIPGGDKLLEDVVLRINRAAEDAAREAAPIFLSSIRSMTITDAMNILKGEDDAATQYLKGTSSDQLFQLFHPKIKASAEKKLVAGISTSDSWNKLRDEWNKIALSTVGRIAGFQTVDIVLEDYLTQKALDGLFLKISGEEKKIRTDVSARVTTLLKRVFGTV